MVAGQPTAKQVFADGQLMLLTSSPLFVACCDQLLPPLCETRIVPSLKPELAAAP